MVDCLCMTMQFESMLPALEVLLGLSRVLALCFWRVNMSLLSCR